MNKSFLLMSVVGMLLGSTGCISNHVSWVRGWEPDMPEKLNANYRFAGDKGPAALAATKLNFVERPDGEVMEMSIFLRKGEPENGNWLLAKVNNIVSFFTVGIWPWVRSQNRDCVVEVVANGEKAEREFVMGHRVWSSFILPLPILPCPGWGDWRSSPTFSLDMQEGPGQEMWEAEIVAGYAGELLTKEFLAKVKERQAQSRQAAAFEASAKTETEE